MIALILSFFLISSPILEGVDSVMIQEQIQEQFVSDLEDDPTGEDFYLTEQEIIDSILESEDEYCQDFVQDGSVSINHTITIKHDYARYSEAVLLLLFLSLFGNICLYLLYRRERWG